MKRVTLKEIAEETDVSIATVSMVMNGKGPISKKVKDRILDSAAKLGYVKNIYAAGMASNSAHHIAVLINADYEKEVEWHLIRSIFIPLESVLYEKEYYLILIPVTTNQTNDTILKKVILSGAGGVFTIQFGNRELHQMFEDRGLPAVILNKSTFESDFYTVSSDNFYGMHKATLALLDIGHTKIFYIDYERPEFPAVVMDRFWGFKYAIETRGLNPEDYKRLIVDINSVENISGVVADIMDTDIKPTALVLHDDHLAVIVYIALVRQGFRIPDDVSIIAPGDTLDYNQPFVPQISTTSINTDLMGQLGAEMMLRRIEGHSSENEIIKVKPNIIDRGSYKSLI
jgi:LacI family transcriptional regulator